MQVNEIISLLKTEFGKDILFTKEISPSRGLVRIDPERIVAVAEFLFIRHGFRFIIASGFDSKEGLEIMYHFMLDESHFILNVNVVLPREDPWIDSITPLIKGANWIEREILEILGIQFRNHPQPEPLLSGENWEKGYYPYRRENKDV
ncbi:MAG: NADH-quinone oxidoreductase subunit C [Cyclobacteriaceae bacterium]|nr:NADH-quinone oxidoreductase subunit C [Cyclobacteriaceae bacterium]